MKNFLIAVVLVFSLTAAVSGSGHGPYSTRPETPFTLLRQNDRIIVVSQEDIKSFDSYGFEDEKDSARFRGEDQYGMSSYHFCNENGVIQIDFDVYLDSPSVELKLMLRQTQTEISVVATTNFYNGKHLKEPVTLRYTAKNYTELLKTEVGPVVVNLMGRVCPTPGLPDADELVARWDVDNVAVEIPEDIQELVDRLSHEDWKVRSAAARELNFKENLPYARKALQVCKLTDEQRNQLKCIVKPPEMEESLKQCIIKSIPVKGK